MYKYFVSYAYLDGKYILGFGNVEISHNKEITKFDEINEMTNIIEENLVKENKELYEGIQVIILNYKLLGGKR